MIRQFVPGDFCLDKCRLCCRFSQEDSVWSPCLLDSEEEVLLRNNLAAGLVTPKKKFRLLPFAQEVDPRLPGHMGEIFICPLLEMPQGKCKVYSLRPFECQLYPFLINKRGREAFLSVDLGCPYVKDKFELPEFREYARQLSDFLNLPSQKELLKSNPQLVQTYTDARDIAELKIS
jgi:Fe-S-cluster containining protein